MHATLTSLDGTTTEATDDAAIEAARANAPYWIDLDVDGDDDTSLTTLLTSFGFHPVAIRAALGFDQRPRIDDYDGYAHVIVYGMAANGTDLCEVHLFVTESGVLSLHQGPVSAFDEVRSQLAGHPAIAANHPAVVVCYLVMDALADSYFPVLASFDDQIDDLETAILKTPTEEQLGTLFAMKRQIMAIRKAVNPQRDMVAALNAGVVTIPGLTDQGGAYYRSLYDHLIRIGDQIDGYRDLVASATDTHLAMVSNRLNVVMKQLAIVATVFMPLGWITGFVGQNLGWPIAHWYASGWGFLVFGVFIEIIAVVGVLWVFKRRGWLSSGPTA